MGVHGLWQLIEPSGKPVPLETLENKVLAVDVSIWLHQAVKGFQDSKGAPVPNAHLLGIYHRVCKLLYFKIKPVFIFDGGVPALKKQTIAKRNQEKSRNVTEAERLQKQILNTLLKHSAVSRILSEKTKASLTVPPKKTSRHESIYALPPSELDSTMSSTDEELETSDSSPTKHWDLHTIDMSSTHFKSLPVDVRHEILTDLKETRKQSSWGRIHELPKQSDEFSGYQMNRLLKRQAVQAALEDAEKEMGGHSLSLAELESLLKDHGVATTNDIGKRIASDENTKYLYIKDVKQAIEKARQEQVRKENMREEEGKVTKEEKSVDIQEIELQPKSKADLEFEEDLQKAIALSLEQEPSTSKVKARNSDTQKLEFSFLENFDDEDFQSDSSEEAVENPAKKILSSVHNYMIEYSGLTPSEIAKIMDNKSKKPLKNKEMKNIKKKVEPTEIEISDNSISSDEAREVPLKEIFPDDNVNVLRHNEVKSSELIEENKFPAVSNSECNDISVGGQNKEITESIKRNENISCNVPYIEIKSSIEVTKDMQQNLVTNKLGLTEKDKVEVTKNVEKFSIISKDLDDTSKPDEVGDVSCREVKIDGTKDMKNKEKSSETVKASNICTQNSNTQNGSIEEIEEGIDTIEIMSDSGESSGSIEFLEVSEKKQNENSVEIVLDPNKDVNTEDDLFSGIFNKNGDFQKEKPLEIVIDTESKPDDDLFSDIFEAEPTEVKEKSIAENNMLKIQRVANISTVDVKASVTDEFRDNKLENEMKEIISPVEDAKIPLTVQNKDTECIQNDSVEKIVEVSEKTSAIQQDSKKSEINKEVEKVERLQLTTEEMYSLKNNLQREKIDLMVEKSTRERMATNITDQMYQEAKELLELFGMPYIVAPMEAEAQCAFLDAIELTDGTITDDSDIWLFGGRTVYKNFFNQSKYVMEFRAENIKHHFKLTREQMILLALLVGSDYTIGIQGIGPVTALEILAAFPPSQTSEFTLSHSQLTSGLKEFRSWLNKGRTAGPGRSALKSKLKNVSLTDNFPSLQVVQAYLEPTVDPNREKFSWDKPDFAGLTDFARQKFGWSTKKTEEILKPIIKRMEERKTQMSIKDYFKTTFKVHCEDAKGKMSKRVKTAIDRIGKTPEELIAEEMEALSKAQHKKSRSRGQNRKSSQKKEKGMSSKEENTKQRRTRKNKQTTDSGDNKTEDFAPDMKKPRRKRNSVPKTSSEATTADAESSSEQNEPQGTTEDNELQKLENIAKNLRRRRQRRNELSKNLQTVTKKQVKPQPKNLETVLEEGTISEQNSSQSINEQAETRNRLPGEDRLQKELEETIPKDLLDDEEIQFFQATTSRSLKRVEEIDHDLKNELEQEVKKKRLVNMHKKEVIHQKLMDKSELLRNKMKAIEVYRKSKKGPGFVQKRKRNLRLTKQDAELSEDSSNE